MYAIFQDIFNQFNFLVNARDTLNLILKNQNIEISKIGIPRASDIKIDANFS